MRPQMQFLMKRGLNGAVAMCTCTTKSWPHGLKGWKREKRNAIGMEGERQNVVFSFSVSWSCKHIWCDFNQMQKSEKLTSKRKDY